MLDLYTSETTLSGGGDGAEPAPPAEVAPDPSVEAGSAPATEEQQSPVETDGSAGVPIDDIDAIVSARVEETVANLLGGLNPPQPPAGAPPFPLGGHEFDWSSVSPYEEDFGAKLGAGIQQAVNQSIQMAMSPILAAVMQQQEAAEAAEAEQRAQDLIASEIAAHGDMPETAKQMIRPLAEHLLPDLIERYGNTPRAHELAVEKAAAQLRQTLKEAAEQMSQQEKNRLATLAGAPGEVGSAAGAPLVPGAPIKVPQIGEIARKYATR